MEFEVPFISKRKYVNALRNERVRRIGVVFEVLERIPRFIDEVTRIRGVDLYVGVRTRGKYYRGFAEWANKFPYLISSARKVLSAFECIIGDQ